MAEGFCPVKYRLRPLSNAQMQANPTRSPPKPNCQKQNDPKIPANIRPTRQGAPPRPKRRKSQSPNTTAVTTIIAIKLTTKMAMPNPRLSSSYSIWIQLTARREQPFIQKSLGACVLKMLEAAEESQYFTSMKVITAVEAKDCLPEIIAEANRGERIVLRNGDQEVTLLAGTYIDPE